MLQTCKQPAGLRKLGPKNNIPEVFLTRKAKNMNHGSPLFPTIYVCMYNKYLQVSLYRCLLTFIKLLPTTVGSMNRSISFIYGSE